MTIESRLLVSIEHLKRTLSFFVHSKKTDSEHSKSFPHAVKTENSTKFDEIHNIHDFGIPAQVDPMVNFQDENDKVKIGAKGQKRSHSHPQACPLQTGLQKKQKYKKCKFSPITKNGPMVNIPMGGGGWFFEAIRPRSLTLVLKKKLSKLTTCSLWKDGEPSRKLSELQNW